MGGGRLCWAATLYRFVVGIKMSEDRVRERERDWY